MPEGRCSPCAVLLLELARAGGNPRLWTLYGLYAESTDADPEEVIEEAVRAAGPDLLTLTKESLARRGVMVPEHLGVSTGPTHWATVPQWARPRTAF